MTVRKRGNAWQAIVIKKAGGKIIHQESRTFTDPDINRAERLCRKWYAEVKARIKTVGVPQRALQTTTLGALLRDYKNKVAAVRPLNRSMEYEIEQLASEFDGLALGSITGEHFTKFALRRRAQGAGGATVLHNLATLRSVLNSAKPMFGLDVSGTPVSEAIAALNRIGATHKGETRSRRPSPDELAALDKYFKRTAGHPSTIIPMDTVIDLCVKFPRRIGELTDMKWVDYEEGIVTLRDTKNPTRPRTEIVPVPRAGREIIEALPVIDERILPYKSESVSAAFERACKRLDIRDLHLHDLRHEGITRLFEAGLQIPEVAMVSGHLSWNMLRRYTNLRPETVREKMDEHVLRTGVRTMQGSSGPGA